MSYNILNKNVKFQGTAQGTIEDVVDIHSDQTIAGKKTVTYLTASNLSVTNKIGIGTTSPEALLDIKGNGAADNEVLRLSLDGDRDWSFAQEGSGAGTGLRLRSTAGKDFHIDATSTIFRNYNGSGEVLRVDPANGRVGVGTNNPSHKLHVNGNIGVTNITAGGTITSTGNISGSANLTVKGYVTGSTIRGDGQHLTNIKGTAITLATGSALSADANGLTVNLSGLGNIGSVSGGDDFLLIHDDGVGLKRVSAQAIANLYNAAVTTYSPGANDRVLTSNGAGNIQDESQLTFDTTNGLVVSNKISGSTTLQIAQAISCSNALVREDLKVDGQFAIGTNINNSFRMTLKVDDSTNDGGFFIDMDESGTGKYALKIDSEADAQSLWVQGKYASYFKQDVSNGYAGFFYRNLAETGAQPLVTFNEGGKVSTQTVLKVTSYAPGDIANFFSASTEVMTLTSPGNLGVGVADPDSRIEIMDSSVNQLKISYDASNATTFAVNNAGKLTVTTGGDMSLASNVAIDGNTTLGNAGGDAVTINASTVATPNGLNFDTNTLVIDQTNNRVGIGVAAPDQALEVSGAIHISAESAPPSAPADGDGGILYTKADGKIYWVSNELSETDLTSGGGGGSTDIDSLSALGGTGLHQTQDHFMFSDNGTEKKITFSNLEDAIFGNISGDATIAAGGALTIAANAVQDGMVNDDVATGLAGNGLGASSGVLAVQVSGAVHITGDKVAITGSLAGAGIGWSGHANSVSSLELDINELAALGGTGLHQTQDKFLFTDNGAHKTITFSNLEDAIFGNVSGDATIAAGGALTIAANAVEGSMLNSNVAGSGLNYGSNELSIDLTDKGFGGGANRLVTDDGDGTVTTEANLTFDGTDLGVSDKIFHIGDVDTFINFTDDDINFQAGGVNFLDLTEDTQNEVTFNEGGVDIDFRVETADESHMLFIEGSSNRMSIGDNTGSPGATLEIKNHASAGATGVPLLQLNNNDTDQQCLDINAGNIDANVVNITANDVTTARVLSIGADGLTTGNALYVDDNSSNTGTRNSALIIQNNAAAIAATALAIQSDGGVTGVKLDKNYSDTAEASIVGLDIDWDKTGASTTSNTMYGINIDMDNTTATNGANYMYGLHVTPTLTHAADAGSSFVYGALINAQGGTNGTSLVQGARIEAGGGDINYGLQLDVQDGGVDLRIESSADSGDYFQIQTTTHGATTITTVDDDATAADLTFTVDGDITLEPAGGNIVIAAGAAGTSLSHGGTAGGAGVSTRMVVRKTSISDNVATNVVTFTVPNAAHAAAVKVFGVATYNTCNYAQSFEFKGTIARSSGNPTDKSFGDLSTRESANLGGGHEFAIEVDGSANTGANSASQTFTLTFTINTDTSASSNATFVIELINFNSSGITMAPA